MGSTVALCSLCAKPMPNVPLKRCKAFRLGAAVSVLVGAEASVCLYSHSSANAHRSFKDKAAQAAAQAAQAAALQAHLQCQTVPPPGAITYEQYLLQQMQLVGLLPPGAAGDVQSQQNQSQPQSMASQNDESLQNVVFSTRDVNSSSPFGVQPAGGFGGDIRTPRAGLSTSFSPFSPDPNHFHGGDLPSGAAPRKREPLLYHPSSDPGFAHGFGSGPALPHDLSNTMGADGSVTVPHYPMYHELPASGTISRPPSGSLSTSQELIHYFEMPEHDVITDLNGMLASLDLDGLNHHQSPSPSSASAPTSSTWKTPGNSSPSAA